MSGNREGRRKKMKEEDTKDMIYFIPRVSI
jgi:hypothetical protein